MEVEILIQKGYHFLWIDGECWMWDLPTECRAQESLAQQAFGDVLVAGYGLGLVQEYLLTNPNVVSVRTAENCPGLIKECRRVFDNKLHGYIIFSDFFALDEQIKFDCVLGDIWLDVAPEYLRAYLTFKRKAERLIKPNGRILAWGSECFEIWSNKEPER